MAKVIEILGEPVQHGGQEKFLEYILSYMDSNKYRIDVLTPYFCDNTVFSNLVESRGGRIIEFHQDFNPGQSRYTIYRPLLEFLQKENYDVAHIHSGSVSVLALGAKAAKKAGIKKILVHSHCTGNKNLKHALVKLIYGKIIQHNATDFLACSYQAGEMKYPQSVLKNKLVVVANGIEIEKYKLNKEIRMKQRDLLGIPQDAFVIGHVGRFSYQKNHQFLIDVFNEIQKIIPNSYLLLVGEGELMEQIKDQVHFYNLDNKVIFTGSVDNVQDHYQAMDVFLFPSNFEGLGYVLLEAQAAGLPCIASTAVPEDVILSEVAIAIDLAEKKEWVQKAIEYRNAKCVNNDEAIRNAGYDINHTITQIKAIYSREKA